MALGLDRVMQSSTQACSPAQTMLLPHFRELPLVGTLDLALLPVYIPGHSKVSNFSHSPRPSTGKEAVPRSNIPTRKGKKSNRKRRST